MHVWSLHVFPFLFTLLLFQVMGLDAAKKKVIIFGDSLTKYLQTDLEHNNTDFHVVCQRGARINSIITSIESTTFQEVDAIVVHEGTNDLDSYTSPLLHFKSYHRLNY